MRTRETTTRHLMALVVAIAAATWAGLAAERARSNRSRFHTHFHANGVPHDRSGSFGMTPEWVPFWPVYWRTLLGLPWDWRYRCVPGDRRRETVCGHDFPRLYVPGDGGRQPWLDYDHLLAVFDARPPQDRGGRAGSAAPRR